MSQLGSVQRLGVFILYGAVARCAVATEPLTQADFTARSASDLKLIGQVWVSDLVSAFCRFVFGGVRCLLGLAAIVTPFV